MEKFLLKDLETGEIDAIITAETTSAEEIGEIIFTVRSQDSWSSWEDVIKSLPKDVTFEWTSGMKTIIY